MQSRKLPVNLEEPFWGTQPSNFEAPVPLKRRHSHVKRIHKRMQRLFSARQQTGPPGGQSLAYIRRSPPNQRARNADAIHGLYG